MNILDLTGPTVKEAVEKGLHTLVFRNNGPYGWVLQPTKLVGTQFWWDAPAEWCISSPFQSIMSKSNNWDSPTSLLTVTKINEHLAPDSWFELIGCFKPIYDFDHGHSLKGWLQDLCGVSQRRESSDLDHLYRMADVRDILKLGEENVRRRIMFTFIFPDAETRNSCLPSHD
jgi:hypothetical protein